MIAIDQALASDSYHHARAAQERQAAIQAADERSRNLHLHMAVMHELYSVFGPPRTAPASIRGSGE